MPLQSELERHSCRLFGGVGFVGEVGDRDGWLFGEWRKGGVGWADQFERRRRRSGRIGDTRGPISVDGWKSVEEKAADEGEDGSAARGDAVGGEEFVETAEAEVDALSSLEALAIGEERLSEIVGILLRAEMSRTETGARVRGEETALAAFSGAIGTTDGKNCGLSAHDDVQTPTRRGSFLMVWSCGVPTPGLLLQRVRKVLKRQGIVFWRGPRVRKGGYAVDKARHGCAQ